MSPITSDIFFNKKFLEKKGFKNNILIIIHNFINENSRKKKQYEQQISGNGLA